VKRAGEGAADALTAVGYTGDVDKHPACQEIRTFISGAGKKGIEVRKQFTGAGYGWPQDAVDGALLVLVASGFVRAARNDQSLTAKEISQSQIGVIDFRNEGVAVTSLQRIVVRKLIVDLELPCNPGEEAAAIPRVLQRLTELGRAAGGEPPLPEPSSLATIETLQTLSGNEQIVAVYEHRTELQESHAAWTQLKEKNSERLPRWHVLQRFLQHAGKLPAAAEVLPQTQAIHNERALLTDPDPVAPLVAKLTATLRAELLAARQRLVDMREKGLASLAATAEWQRLSPVDQQRILAENDLGPAPELHVGTDETLLAALDAACLEDWKTKAEAIPARVDRAREAAARLLEPKAVRLSPRSVTLKSEGEVDGYLQELRADIMAYIKAGHPVIL